MSREEEIQEDSFSSDTEFDDEEDSESSSDVDAKLEQDEVFDADFLKCYSALRKKDPKIYDDKVKFFNTNKPTLEDNDVLHKSTVPKMTLLDYQLDNDKNLTDNKEEPAQASPKSFYEKELDDIKKSIEQVGDSESDEELLVVKGPKRREKTKTILDKLDGDQDIDHLKEIWNEPSNLPKEDRFLRDYILNKRYLPKSVESKGDEDDECDATGFFSRNLDALPDLDDKQARKSSGSRPTFHSEEKDFDEIARIPRNSTKTIRDLVEKQKKKEKRMKMVEKKKKMLTKEAEFEGVVGDIPTKFHYIETEPVDYGLTAEEILMASDDELEKKVKSKKRIKAKDPREASKDKTETNDTSELKSKKKKHKRRGLNHKKFAKTGVAPDRLLAYGLSKTRLKKWKLL